MSFHSDLLISNPQFGTRPAALCHPPVARRARVVRQFAEEGIANLTGRLASISRHKAYRRSWPKHSPARRAHRECSQCQAEKVAGIQRQRRAFISGAEDRNPAAFPREFRWPSPSGRKHDRGLPVDDPPSRAPRCPGQRRRCGSRWRLRSGCAGCSEDPVQRHETNIS